jgi:hypothetical protein
MPHIFGNFHLSIAVYVRVFVAPQRVSGERRGILTATPHRSFITDEFPANERQTRSRILLPSQKCGRAYNYPVASQLAQMEVRLATLLRL